MSWKIIIGVLIGAGLGALLGSTRSCESGACPLTATPWRGALYGAFIGLLFGLSMGTSPSKAGSNRPKQKEVLTAPAEDATIRADDSSDKTGRDADRPNP
jgi:hypothetical protein